MVDLAAIGRARPVGAIQNFQMENSKMESLGKRRAVMDLQMKNIQQDMDINKRKEDLEIETQRKELEPKSVLSFFSKFEGGIDGRVGQMVHKDLVDAGYIKMGQGGYGTITKAAGREALKLTEDPIWMAKISRERIAMWQEMEVDIKTRLEQKPDDPKLQAEAERIKIGINQAYGQDEALDEWNKNRSDGEDEKPGTPSNFEAEFLDENTKKLMEENPELSYPDAMKQSLGELEGTKKKGKFAPKSLVNIDMNTKIKEKAKATDYAFWTGSKSKEEARDIAKEKKGESWADFADDEKDFYTWEVQNEKIKEVSPESQYGKNGKGEHGWFAPNDEGEMVMIKRWSK